MDVPLPRNILPRIFFTSNILLGHDISPDTKTIYYVQYLGYSNEPAYGNSYRCACVDPVCTLAFSGLSVRLQVPACMRRYTENW